MTYSFTTAERRLRLLSRHHLAGEAAAGSVLDATRGVLALHATDPATIFLSALARDPDVTMDDVGAALYTDRTVLRMMAMRRTLFVVPLDDAPIVHAAASMEVAVKAWRRMAGELAAAPTDPPLPAGVDPADWLAEVGDAAVAIVEQHGPMVAADIVAAEPRLATAILPIGNGKAWDIKQAITSRVLMALGADGRIVRGQTQGTWTSRRHRWESPRHWWPDGMPQLDPASARASLVQLWLRRFGPATVADVQWWTGWTLGNTRKALAESEILEVDLDGTAGIALADDLEVSESVAPVINLLPALDPTPMGWKERDWYFDVDRGPLFDRNGNVGPTIWCDGGIVGGWGSAKDGSVRWRLLTDIGSERTAEVAQAAADLERRLDGKVIVPSFRTPLEKELSLL